MTCRNFLGSEFLHNRLYIRMTRVLPENEQEELRGETEELYRQLIIKHHSRTDATLRTLWQALMFVTGICFDNAVVKTGTFQEEALKIKSFFGSHVFVYLFSIDGMIRPFIG